MNKRWQKQWIKSECEWYTQFCKRKCVCNTEELAKVHNIWNLK